MEISEIIYRKIKSGRFIFNFKMEKNKLIDMWLETNRPRSSELYTFPLYLNHDDLSDLLELLDKVKELGL